MLSLAVLLALTGSVLGQSPEAQMLETDRSSATSTSNDLEETTSRVRALVSQLDSPSFAEREASASDLLRLGESAITALRSILSQPHLSLEARSRVQTVVLQLEREKFESLSKSFLVDTDPTHSYGLPAWESYAKVAGSSRTSKLIFLDMLRQQPELMRMLDDCGPTPSLEQQKEIESASLRLAVNLRNRRMARAEYPEVGDVLAVLFSTCMLQQQTPVPVNDFLLSSIRMTPVASYVQRKGHGKVIRALYNDWLPKTHDAAADNALNIVLVYDLSSGRELGRRFLASNYSSSTRVLALQTLSRFGDESDLDRLLPLLNDETLCRTFKQDQFPIDLLRGIHVSDEPPPAINPPQPGQIEQGTEPPVPEAQFMYRICDVALAASKMIAGEDLRDAFPNFLPHRSYAFDIRSVAILDSENAQRERDVQIRTWHERLTARTTAAQ